MPTKLIYILSYVGRIFFWIIVWEVSVRTTRLSEVVPSLFEVVEVIKISTNRIEIWYALLGTLRPTFMALILSVFVGYILGVLMGSFKLVRGALYALLNALKSIPVTVFIPTFIVLFGLTSMIVPLISVPLISIIAVNLADACLRLSENRLILLKPHSIRKVSLLKHIVFWETLEVLFSTLRVVLTYAIALEVAIDYFLRIDGGIGDYIYEMYSAEGTTHFPEMYAAILTLGLTGIVMVRFLARIIHKTKK